MKRVVLSTSFISGADGPTAVFLAGKIGRGTIIAAVAIGVVLVLTGVLLLVRRKK